MPLTVQSAKDALIAYRAKHGKELCGCNDCRWSGSLEETEIAPCETLSACPRCHCTELFKDGVTRLVGNRLVRG
jgi:hypothetical protein